MDTFSGDKEVHNNETLWLQMKAKVKETRSQVFRHGGRVPTSFTLWPYAGNVNGGGGSHHHNGSNNGTASNPVQILFLCMEEPITENTLFSVNIHSEGSGGDYSMPWTKMVDPTGFPQQAITASKEEQLMNERKRCYPWGINSYQLCPKSGRVIFQTNGSLYLTSCSSGGSFREIQPNSLVRLNPIMSPNRPDLIAYYSSTGNICLHNCASNQDLQLTQLSEEDVTVKGIVAGYPSYITQEEFNRYIGYWWCPVLEDDRHFLLYEEVDASQVDVVSLIAHDDFHEKQRFPRAGGINTRSHLKLIDFKVAPEADVNLWSFNIYDHFPWCEYVVRMDWTPDGKCIWAFLLDRCQRRLEVVIIDRRAFFESKTFPSVQVIFREDSDSWINVSDIMTILKSSQRSIDFIISSEESGFRHLLYVQAELNLEVPDQESELDEEAFRKMRLQPQIRQKVPLTSGNWSVSSHPVKVDTARSLVFFHGYKDTPLEKHAYVVSIDKPGHIRRLTDSDYSHSADFFDAHDIMVSVFSNIENEASCKVSRLKFPTDFGPCPVDSIQFQNLGWILKPKRCETLPLPRLLSHKISSGDVLYSIMYLPDFHGEDVKYPVVLNIYGGPDFQLVTNSFKGGKCVRNYLLSSCGYVVISIDSRGSSNRGKAFESHIYRRLGQLELADQLEVLRQMADEFPFLDLSRVAINGWSYGGYLALRGIIDYPDVFKLAIAGAPVTDWELYDTAYTERYMDLPKNNLEGYSLGSVVAKASCFPDERDRLLVAHGKLDDNVHFQHTEKLLSALTQHQKPFRLQVYPTERHSLRAMDASEHFETTLICFLADHL